MRDQYGIAAGDFARRRQRFAQFVDVQKSLEHQQVDALFHERLELLAKDVAGLGERSRAQGFEQHAKGSHCAGDENVGALLRSFACGANAYVRKPLGFTEFAAAAQSVGLFWLLWNEPPPVLRGTA